MVEAADGRLPPELAAAPHWPHRQHSRLVAAGGVRWHVQLLQPETGPAPGAVVWLLHGTGAASHSWRYVAPLLAAQARATVVVPDLPGHGFSSRLPAAQQSLAGMAAALGALATALGLGPAQQLIGHSAGTALALRAVLDGHLPVPQRVVGLNAALLPFGGLAGKVFGPMAWLLARQPLVPWLFTQRAKDASSVRRLVAATGSRLDDEGLALYGQLLRTPSHVAGALAMMGHWDLAGLWRDLPGLPCPLQLLVGERDATVPPAQAQQVCAQVPGCTLHSLGPLGHLAHEEDAAAVLAALAQPDDGRVSA